MVSLKSGAVIKAVTLRGGRGDKNCFRSYFTLIYCFPKIVFRKTEKIINSIKTVSLSSRAQVS